MLAVGPSEKEVLFFSDVPKYLFLNGIRIYFPIASTFGFGDLKIFLSSCHSQ